MANANLIAHAREWLAALCDALEAQAQAAASARREGMLYRAQKALPPGATGATPSRPLD